MGTSLHRTILRFAAATLAGVACATAVAAPAQADVELYKHEYFGGIESWWVGDNSDYAGDGFADGSPLNDQVTSIKNAISSGTCYYTNANYGGDLLFLGNNVWQVHIGSVFNDKLSSHDAYRAFDFNCPNN